MGDSTVIVAELAQRAVERGQVGLAVGAIAGGEEEIFGLGRARDDSEASPDGQTTFEIGSITKVFTGLLLAEMAGAGLVGLDDPLDSHLPPGVSAPVRDVPVTLAELASHSAGLPREPKGTLAYVVRHPLHPYRALLESYAGRTVDDVYASLAQTKARRRGARVRYSSLGAGLLGNVLASRAGTSYEEAVRSRICLPLAMEGTFVTVPEPLRPRLAHGHTRRGRPRPPLEDPALPGAGLLRSTAADMIAFLRANLEPPDGPLGSAIELAQRPRARIGRRIEVGLGWIIAPLRRRGPLRMLCHNGGTGGFRSFAGLVRETNTAVVVLGNTNRSVDRLAIRLLEALNGDRSR